jgi:hypothetical protein
MTEENWELSSGSGGVDSLPKQIPEELLGYL